MGCDYGTMPRQTTQTLQNISFCVTVDAFRSSKMSFTVTDVKVAVARLLDVRLKYGSC